LDKPDFANYSEAQLRQILTRIDKERFPDRVEEIHGHLARFEADRLNRPAVDEPEPADVPVGIAGFWRRAGAFVIDAVLLAVVGAGLGMIFGTWFESLGAWGRAVGFVIEVAYFGTMESGLFGGRTIGKRMLDIKVVAATGAPLGLGRALLRAGVFHLPYSLNNAMPSSGDIGSTFPIVQGLVVFGLGGAIVYLCVFNRRTRQSVHDLLVGAVVVRAGTQEMPPLAPVWRGHVAIMAALLVAAVGVGAYVHSTFNDSVIRPMLQVQRQVGRLRAVRTAGIVSGVNVVNGGKPTTVISINVVTRSGDVDERALANDVAAIALDTYPAAREVDTLSVSVMHGYDIGIASNWTARNFNAPPGTWRTGGKGAQ
jgi:uncharacterized RDD family membrane protein YckC